MKKTILERKPTPPKNQKEFWEIFVKSCNNTYENQEELDNKQSELKIEFGKVKKYNVIPIILMVVMLFFTSFNSWLYYTEVTQESLISDVTATEYAKRMGNDELYFLALNNYGDVENDLQITITFTLDTKITRSLNIEEEKLKADEVIRRADSEYFVRYEKIRAGENITIRLDITDERLKNNELLLIYPKSIEAYTDEGKIIIHRSFEP